MRKIRTVNRMITTILILSLTMSMLSVINININIFEMPPVYGISIPAGSATYFYVNTTHWSNTSIHASTTPLLHGLGNATTDTTVNVMPGQYDGTYTINTAGLYLVSNQSASNTIINGTGAFTVSAENVTISGFTFISTVSYEVFLIDSTSSTINNVTITNSVFNFTSGQVGPCIGESNGNKVSNVRISYNTFNGPADKNADSWRIGKSFANPRDCEVETVKFEHNTVYNCSIRINLNNESITDILISNNTFRNTDGVVNIWGSGTPTGILSQFMFMKNDVDSTNTYGVGIDPSIVFSDSNFGSGNRINYNNFVGIPGGYGFNATSILSTLTTYELNATLNWWGNETGPYHPTTNPSGTGSAVSDHIDYTPWLIEPYPPAVIVPELYVDPPLVEHRTPAYGKTFLINISLSHVIDLYSFEFKLYWNTTLLKCVESEILPPWEHYYTGKNEINNTAGRYWAAITAMANVTSFNGSTTLVILTFSIEHEPTYPENVSCVLDLNDAILLDSEADYMIHLVRDGEYWLYSNIAELKVIPDFYRGKRLGETFDVNITVLYAVDLYTFEFEVMYNTTLLDTVEVTIGPFLNEPVKIEKLVIDDAAGVVRVRAKSLAPALPASGNGTIATITFKVVHAIPWQENVVPLECALSLNFTELLTDIGATITHDRIDGLYRFDPLAGDLNIDAVVGLDDLYIVSYAFGSEPGDPNWDSLADVDDNLIVNIRDLTLIALNYGKEDC